MARPFRWSCSKRQRSNVFSLTFETGKGMAPGSGMEVCDASTPFSQFSLSPLPKCGLQHSSLQAGTGSAGLIGNFSGY